MMFLVQFATYMAFAQLGAVGWWKTAIALSSVHAARDYIILRGRNNG